MNKAQLQQLLKQEGFRSDVYDLDGGLLPERLTLARDGNRWCVYYSERGLQTGKKCFNTEDAACQHLIDQLRDETSAKRGRY